MLDSRRKTISESIRIIPDFPKKGIMFQDVTTLLLNPEAFQFSIDDFADRYKGRDIEAVVGELQRADCYPPDHLGLLGMTVLSSAVQGLRLGASSLGRPLPWPCMSRLCH